MKLITMKAVVDKETCTGCKLCEKICPVLAIKIVDRKSVVDADKCIGCGNCEQRCPVHAIRMEKLKEPYTLKVEIDSQDYEKIREICIKARMHPEQKICYCTGTRAQEIAAAILKGADSPEKISAMTGVRGGCKVECIQPMLRLLKAAGITPTPPEGGYQWYGITPTVYDIPEEVKAKHSKRGFYFDSDVELFEKVVKAAKKGGK